MNFKIILIGNGERAIAIKLNDSEERHNLIDYLIQNYHLLEKESMRKIIDYADVRRYLFNEFREQSFKLYYLSLIDKHIDNKRKESCKDTVYFNWSYSTDECLSKIRLYNELARL